MYFNFVLDLNMTLLSADNHFKQFGPDKARESDQTW